MKTYVVILFVIISNLSFGQDYKLFHANSKKLFTEYPNPQKAYSIAFDTVMTNGSDSVYYNFLTMGDQFQSDSCIFWGGPFCQKQNVPSWIGKKIEYDNLSDYRFFNLQGDTLNFNFSTNTNDTLLFYKNSIQKFLFVFKKADTLTTLNNSDSARFYQIINTDLVGNIINSPLNQQYIIVSKNFGLTRFFQVDSFPQILKPLVLLGNISPTAGMFNVTNEMLYDFQAGDEFQYHNYTFHPFVPNYPFDYNYYEKFKILNRTVTADSMIYQAIIEKFYIDSSQLTTNNFTLRYYRNAIASQIPYEKFLGNNTNLYVEDYCGLKLWTLSKEPQYLAYCALDTCWGSYDTQGPPPQILIKSVIGIGNYTYTENQFGPPPTGYNSGSQIVYFKKNGIPCGNEVVVGIQETPAIDNSLVICPNPAKDFITITSVKAIKNIFLYNPAGQLILSKSIAGNSETVDVIDLKEGIYFVNVVFVDSKGLVRKIVVIK